MGRVLGKSVLFYLVDQSLAFTNSGLSAVAGTVQINGTDIAVTDMSVAATIQTAINTALGAGTVTVALATETFTVTFNNGTYNEMRVWISTTEVTVSDTTSPTADKIIAEQTNIELSYDIELDDVTNKDSGGNNEVEPVEISLSAMNENIYSDSDANYQFLRDACDSMTPIYALVVKASGDNIACGAVIEKLSEPVETKKVVRAQCSWKSTGNITRIT